MDIMIIFVFESKIQKAINYYFKYDVLFWDFKKIHYKNVSYKKQNHTYTYKYNVLHKLGAV